MATLGPKVFIGGRELSAGSLTADLVSGWIAGPSGQLSEYGYVPLTSGRFIDEQYLKHLTGVTIKDNNISVSDFISTIDFVR